MKALITLGAALAVLAPAGPAQAAPLGTLAITPATGSVDAVFAGVRTSAACPAGYGTNAAIKVGKAGGPYNNLHKVGSAGGYDRAPFTLDANRSLRAAQAGEDGEYQVVVLCTSESQGDHPDLFVAGITVTGGTWKSTGGGAPGGPSQQVNAEVTGPTPTVAATPTRAGGPLPTTGVSLGTLLPAGLVLLGAGAGAVWMVRRRRAA
ncbi:hypothetical protein [Longispora urticae]